VYPVDCVTCLFGHIMRDKSLENMIEKLKNVDIAVQDLNWILESLIAGQLQLGDLLFRLQRVCLEQGGIADLSNATGLGRESLYKILSHNGNPHLSTFIEIIRALGLKIEFKANVNRIGILPLIALAHRNPELAEQWHPTKNGTLLPQDVASGSHAKVWWFCPNGEDHEWISSVIKRASGAGCPICSGKKVVVSNSLLNTHSELIKDWNFDKNQDLNPRDVMAGSTKKVWWQCTKNHEWESSVRDRVIGRGCPVCKMDFRTE